jgi:hypothetical protein
MKSEKFQPRSAKLDFRCSSFAAAIDSEPGLDLEASDIWPANGTFRFHLFVSSHNIGF